MLPPVGFEDHEWPSGVRRRRVPDVNYRHELAGWFGGPPPAAMAPAPPTLKAVGTNDANPESGVVTPATKEWREEPPSGRLPFLIF
jgi:hypothetical protein